MELGRALQAHHEGRLAEAEATYRQILSATPNDARACHLLGLLLYQTGRSQDSLTLLRRSVELGPGIAAYHSNLAGVLGLTGDHEQAAAHLRRAVVLDPNLPDAHHNLGVACEFLGRLQDAVKAHREALRLRPEYPEAHNHLGNALRKLGRIREAVECHRRAIALRPEYAEAYSSLAAALAQQGDQEGVVACHRKAVALQPGAAASHSALLYSMHYHPASTARMLLDEARQWARHHATGPTVVQGRHGNDRHPDRRLRIGYLSPDFRDHTIPRLIAPVLIAHDRSQVEVFCYASVRQPDHVTDRLRSIADAWRDISRLPDPDAADLIRRDRIDILVELAGHWAGNRMTLMARKPAPVQVQIGYPGTTGLEAIEYRITDPYSDPPGLTDDYFTERLVRLPECAWCYDPDQNSPPVAPLPARKAGHVTFGCLNNPIKVTDPALQLWSRILAAVAGSRLLLMSAEGCDDAVLHGRLRRLAIDPGRVDPVRRQPRDGYLALFDRIDIALDPFPYNGETTTCDGLWMGVPLVTLAGSSCVSRRGVSHLTNVGLADLTCNTPDDYVRTAVDLAADLPTLERIRVELRDRMRSSPITDGKRYTRNLEVAYRQMWQRWCADTTSRASSSINGH